MEIYLILKMNKMVRDTLIEIAKRNRIIYYHELCDKCNLGLDMRNSPSDRIEIGRILGIISEYEYSNHRPLLSALVVSRSGTEGDGFYKLCEDLGITSDWKKLKRDDLFSVLEIKKCHDYWRKN